MIWETTRLKHLCMDSGQYGLNVSSHDYRPSGHRLLRTSDIDDEGSIRSRSQGVFVEDPRNLRFELHPGDLLLSRSGTLGRSLLIRTLREPTTFAGYLVRFRPRAGVDPRYLGYVASSGRFQSAIEADATTSTIQNFNAERYANIELRVPCLTEQVEIANYLDNEIARINAVIASRRRMRDLLALKRERQVDEALIRVQDESTLLKYAVRGVGVGIVITPAKWYVDHSGVPALRGVNVKPGTIDVADVVQISFEGHLENLRSRLSTGDVVVVRTGQAGAAAVVPKELDGCNCIDLLIIHPGKDIDSTFLSQFLNSRSVKARIAENSVGSIQAHFNAGAMKNLPFPSIDRKEQKRRVSEMEAAVADLDSLDCRLDSQLTLLSERRQALLTAAVTGEIDVSTARGIEV